MTRPATAADVPDLLALWNPQIRDTTITFSAQEKTAEGVAAMIADRAAAGHVFLVARDPQVGTLWGFATYAPFRGHNDGFARTMEHTIVLAPAAWGRGIGRRLMTALEDHARAAGNHVMVACVTAENAAGLGFHRALGYRDVGLMPETGFKFGRWLDLAILQKTL